MKPTLQLTLGQHLSMAPQLQKAISLFQLSRVDLLITIENILTENPLLERTEEDKTHYEYIQKWEKWGHDNSFCSDNGQLEAQQKVQEMNLQEYLTWQMELSSFNETETIIATSIIDAINDHGFLELELSDLYSSLRPYIDIPLYEIENVLHHIQQFDPPGIGGRNLQECLSLQVKHLVRSQKFELPFANKLILLINQFLPLVAKEDFLTLKKRLHVEEAELTLLIHELKNLYPKPGLLVGTKTTEYIIPDLLSFKQAGYWRVELNPEARPKLQLNEYYSYLIKQSKKTDTFFGLKNQLKDANYFLKNLEMRDNTLLKVAKCIISKQKNFLDFGEEALQPMILQDISQELGLHISTVSRITNQKFIQTSRGTLELKYFFSSPLSTQSGKDFSSKAIKAMIKKVIQQEKLNKPFSDSLLAEKLKELGIPVARRTIGKYREQLGISPSTQRKRPLKIGEY